MNLFPSISECSAVVAALVDIPEQVDGDSQDHMCSCSPQSARETLYTLFWVGVTKSYLEGKFPVICRGGSENLKILRRIVSVQ